MQEIIIRECTTLEEMAECVRLQSEVFTLPEAELSPVRHFIVTRNAGGFVLGAFADGQMVGFTLSVPAFLRGERAFYSHMTGIRPEYQGHGIGAMLKWEQRRVALSGGVLFIKWTFEPVKARNAYFNLEKLGAEVREYRINFYGTDYSASAGNSKPIGLQSDRLFAEWDLDSEKVRTLALGAVYAEPDEPRSTITISNDWTDLVEMDPAAALVEQLRIRDEFESAFTDGLVARGFRRGERTGAYLLFGE